MSPTAAPAPAEAADPRVVTLGAETRSTAALLLMLLVIGAVVVTVGDILAALAG